MLLSMLKALKPYTALLQNFEGSNVLSAFERTNVFVDESVRQHLLLKGLRIMINKSLYMNTIQSMGYMYDFSIFQRIL